jgi:flavin reductase (DIM6/NTAB) family NADH-FMN oxidoreductase RutF
MTRRVTERPPARVVLDVANNPGAGENAFKAVFGRLAQGVTVVTTRGPDGPRAMTATSVSSLSLVPPLALVCFSNASRTLSAVAESRQFAVNMLKRDQSERSTALARSGRPPEALMRLPLDLRHEIPLLRDALAWAVCRLEGLVQAGDHTIAIGLVQAAGHDDGEPLVWHRGVYRGLAP